MYCEGTSFAFFNFKFFVIFGHSAVLTHFKDNNNDEEKYQAYYDRDRNCKYSDHHHNGKKSVLVHLILKGIVRFFESVWFPFDHKDQNANEGYDYKGTKNNGEDGGTASDSLTDQLFCVLAYIS